MKKLLAFIILSLLWSGNSYTSENAWKIKDKYIKPECLADETSNDLYLWGSFDNYQEYYTRYIGIKDFDQYKDKNFKQFVNNVGLYLNKEIPLNDKFAPSWNGDWNNNEDIISLSMELNDCLSSKPIIAMEEAGFIYSYIVEKNIDLKEAKSLAPNIKQEFISIKRVRTKSTEDDGSSIAIFGVLNFDDKLIMVPLKIISKW
jgi:hypothetical protein